MDITIPMSSAAEEGHIDTSDVGPAITPDKVAKHEGTLAAKLRAKAEKLEGRTGKFAVPPADIWEGQLVLVAKPVKIRQGVTNAQAIEEATVELLFQDDDGQFKPIEGGWVGVGEIMGITGDKVTVGQIIKKVCTSDDVVAAFATDIVSWSLGRRSQLEQALGE